MSKLHKYAQLTCNALLIASSMLSGQNERDLIRLMEYGESNDG